MANIKLNNNEYPIPDSALAAPTADFVAHLGTIAGNGMKVVVNGVEYGIDSTKVAGAIAEIETFLGGLGEERLEGDGAEYYTFAPTALSFRSTAPLNELQEIQINGVTVDPANYTLEEGSTIVTFPIDYLKTLNVGNYEVAVASDSKTVKGDFTVAAPNVNEYGFYYNTPYVGRVEYFNTSLAVVFKNTGEANIIDIYSMTTEVCTWSMQTSNTLRIQSSLGEFDCIIDTYEQLSCTALGSVFGVDTSMCTADRDWLYFWSLAGWKVKPLDAHKSQYAPIKGYVNDSEINELCDMCFYESQEITQTPEMPSTLDIIGNGCFQNCTNLTSVSIPILDGGLRIGGYAFSNTGISEITLPSPKLDIDAIWVYNGAFSDCKNLRKVVIGERVNMYEAVFYNCVNLTTIIYEGTMAQWNALSKGEDWNYGVPATYVQCSDGQVAL